jgi:YD repeat-containing protein
MGKKGADVKGPDDTTELGERQRTEKWNFAGDTDFGLCGNLSPIHSITYHQERATDGVCEDPSGTVSYTYDNAGNVLTRTDQRGIVTTYSGYDALNRPGTISYSDGTPTVTLGYDGVWSAFGQLTSIANANSSTNLTAFDTWGRVTASTQQTGGQTYNFTYGYNLGNCRQGNYRQYTQSPFP